MVTGESGHLLAELSAADRRRLIGKKNALLRKAARPEEPLPPSVFGQWIELEGSIRGKALAFLVGEGRCLQLWARSEWGLYCVLVAAAAETIEERLRVLSQAPRVSVEWRHSVADLPSW